jgi:hypothetical protein
MGKKKKREWIFFINSKGRIEFNKLCKACMNECKQSHKAAVIICRRCRRNPKTL